MTARQVFEGMLIELSKVNAPSLLLSEFNYYFNKAINNYINKRYNIYDINQQTTDDIRVLKSTALLSEDTDTLFKAPLGSDYNPESRLGAINSQINRIQGATYEGRLPMDYLHLLNCICVFRVKKTWKCYDAGSYVPFAATRLTADSWSTIMNDWYNRPSPERPYYYIHNVNISSELPTNPLTLDEDSGEIINPGTDMLGIYKVSGNGGTTNGEESYELSANEGSNFPRVIKIGEDGNTQISTIEKATAHRYGNASPVRLEIRYGKDDSVFELVEVAIDYIKTPQHIRLTLEQMDMTEDTSQIMEFPDYVCQEIINELATLVMVRTGDPIAGNFSSVNTTIANPAQALSQPQAAQSAS